MQAMYEKKLGLQAESYIQLKVAYEELTQARDLSTAVGTANSDDGCAAPRAGHPCPGERSHRRNRTRRGQQAGRLRNDSRPIYAIPLLSTPGRAKGRAQGKPEGSFHEA